MSIRPGTWSKACPRRLSVVAALLLVCVGSLPAAAAPAQSGTCTTCLGPQTNTLWDGYFPLGGFARYGKPLTRYLRQEVLFIDFDDKAGSEGEVVLWPLVKALDAFGSWTGAMPAKQSCSSGNLCLLPTFDLSHAVFRSRYAALSTAYIAHSGACDQRLPPEAVRLLEHERWTFGPTRFFSGKCWNPPGNAFQASAPLLLVGGYLQIGQQVVTSRDFLSATSNRGQDSWLPFAAVQDALVRNAPTSQVTQGTLYNVNAEANLIEALICHADGAQPKKACRRGVIKRLLKRIH